MGLLVLVSTEPEFSAPEQSPGEYISPFWVILTDSTWWRAVAALPIPGALFGWTRP